MGSKPVGIIQQQAAMFGIFKRAPRAASGVALIQPLGVEINVSPEQTLLQAALGIGLDFPFSCKVGTCATCRCRLIDGRVKPIRDFSYVLSGEEIRNGYILACQSRVRPGEKIVVELGLDANRPRFPRIRTRGRLVSMAPLTHDIREVCVEVEQPISYAAGQYASLLIPGLDRARDYSFASAPSADGGRLLTFYIRHVPGGRFTEWLFTIASAGDRLEVEGPLGDFWLRPGRAPLLFVAGGSGLAPIRALLEEMMRAPVARAAVVLFGARARRDLYDLERVEKMAARWKETFSFMPILSDEAPDSDWTGRRGLVTDYISGKWVFRLDSCHAYLSGPPAMIDAALAVLVRAGIPHAHIHYDKFLDARELDSRANTSAPTLN